MPALNNRPFPIFYYIGLVTYLLNVIKVELVWHIPLIDLMLFVSLIFLTIHVFFVIKLYKPMSLLYLGAIFCLCIIVGINCHQLYFFYTSFLLVFGAKGIDYDKILAVHFAVGVSILFISVVGAKIGLIKNVLIYRSNISDFALPNLGSSARQSLGYVWPTGVAIHASFVLLCYWLIRKGETNIIDLFIYIFCALILFFDTDTKQAVITIMILPLLSWLIEKSRYDKINKMYLLLCYSIPVLAIISLWMTLAYDSSNDFWVAANIISTGRLELSQDAIVKYGIPFWGQYFEMYGAEVSSYYYNYIDSSYIQSLVLWGGLMTIILISVYVYICKQAYRRHDLPLIFAVMVAGLSSVTSQDLFQIVHCPILLALFAEHKNKFKYYVNER